MAQIEFEKFKNFIIELLEQKEIKEIEFNNDAKDCLEGLVSTFGILIRYESNCAYKDENKIKDMFLKNKFFLKSYHEDTEDYFNLIMQYPELKKLNDGEQFKIDITEDIGGIDKTEIYIKEGYIIKSYTVCRPKNYTKQLVEFPKAPRRVYDMLKRNRGVTVKGLKLEVPSSIFNYYFGDKLPNEVKTISLKPSINTKGNLVEVFGEEYTENFFKSGLIRIFDKNGEVELTENLDYYMKQIRHKIAHFNLDNFVLQGNCFVKLFTLSNKEIMVVSGNWYDKMFICPLENNVKNIKELYIPTLKQPLKNSDEVDQFVDKFVWLDIKINKFIERGAFEDLLAEYIKKYEELEILTKPVDEYLREMLSQYYECEVVAQKFVNNEIIDKRIKKNKLFFIDLGDDQKLLTDWQFMLFKNLLKDIYQEPAEKDNLLKINSEILIPMSIKLINSYNKFAQTHKVDNCTMGKSIEYAVLLCQLLIYNNLVKNNFVDDVKTTKVNSKLNINYLTSEEGKFREFIKTLDMSKFEIRYENAKTKNKNYHFVESLPDKNLALRIIRNSISHNNFRFKISNSGDYKDVYLKLSSDKNPNIFVSVRIGDFLKLMDHEYFKNNSTDTRIITSEDLEKIIQNKLNSEQE